MTRVARAIRDLLHVRMLEWRHASRDQEDAMETDDRVGLEQKRFSCLAAL